MEVENPFARLARGFTLVELITTLAVVAISLALLMPGWASLTDRTRISSAANGLLGLLRYARSEAVTRQTAVSLCPSDDAATCSGDTSGWQRGYIIFVDTDGDRSRAPEETLLRAQGTLAKSLRLHTTSGRPAIRFRPDGTAWGTNVTFSICAATDGGAHNRAVILLGSGRARVDRRAPGNRPVSCR